ncbi:MAG: cytidine deaminase [Bacteroidota bacterium]
MPTSLRASALAVQDRAYVPFSRQPIGVALGLASGRWVAAPRIESASFPLTIPALQGAWALAAPVGEAILAAASSRPLLESELAFLSEVTGEPWTLETAEIASCGPMPEWTRELAIEHSSPAPTSAAEAMAHALEAATRAVVPASDFRVGAVVVDTSGRWVTGANVEHVGDWTRGLCAERSALVAARAAGLGPISRFALACPKAPGATPCGGCRQLIAEQAPDAEILMWMGEASPGCQTPQDLLPGAFTGDQL